jgi:signal transduction histidine kinase
MYVLIFSLCLYFVYAVIDRKDITLNKKYILSLLLLPIFFLGPTKFNLGVFDVTNCEPVEGKYFNSYQYFFGVIIIIWIIALIVHRYRKAESTQKKQIILLGLGALSFLIAFSWSEIIGSTTLNWEFTQYGLFGIPVFMAFLAYIIVRYQAFNIKLIATQALVVALVILIGSELFFAGNATSQILILITLVISIGFGYMLVKSVKLEVQRKEELQMMSDKLAQANDKLRQLDNAKTEFISIASHQLRTPLTAIKGFVSMLLEGTYGKVNVKIQEVLNKIYLSNERLVNLVEDLLNISRIESGRMEYNFEEQSIETILKELADTFVPTAKGKELDVDLNLPESPLPKIKIDGGKVKEVISNLIDNALKYTKRGGVTVRAELISNFQFPRLPSASPQANGGQAISNKITNPKSQNNNAIRITVADTGIGIPPEELPYLFSKFSRGKDTARLHVGGTGLGLYVGKFMIEAHQGKIWAESDGAEKGSQFIVELPVV